MAFKSYAQIMETRERERMARRTIVEEETQGEDTEEETEDLDTDDFFEQEIDYGEYEEIEKALQTPPGHYATNPPYTYKESIDTIKVLVEEDGLEQYQEIKRKSYRFWDKLTNVDTGDEQFLGLNVSPRAVYSLGAGDDRKLYLKPVRGARPDFASQNWTQAIKLYKEDIGERPTKVGEVINFLANRQLILTNKEGRKRDDGEPARTFVVGYKLA